MTYEHLLWAILFLMMAVVVAGNWKTIREDWPTLSVVICAVILLCVIAWFALGVRKS